MVEHGDEMLAPFRGSPVADPHAHVVSRLHARVSAAKSAIGSLVSKPGH
jgi:hypothetical protein